jgi:hypothetical protein
MQKVPVGIDKVNFCIKSVILAKTIKGFGSNAIRDQTA